MCSPVLLYWVSVLCRQEAARIRAEFSNVTDDPGGEQSLTLFTPHFSSSTPPLMCSFKPSLSAAAERTFHLLWPPPSSVPCGSHYGQLYFPSQSSVCVCFVCVCASPHFSAETQSVHRGQSSWVDCSEMTLFFFHLFFSHKICDSYVTDNLRNTFLWPGSWYMVGFSWRQRVQLTNESSCAVLKGKG